MTSASSGYAHLCARANVRDSRGIGIVLRLPAVTYGLGIHQEWLKASASVPHYLLPSDISVIGLASRSGMQILGVCFAIALIALAAFLTARTKPAIFAVTGIAMCAGILCSPIGWQEYVLFLAPYWVARPWKKMDNWGASLLFIPTIIAVMIVYQGGPKVGVIVSLPYFAGVVLLLLSFCALNETYQLSLGHSVMVA